MIPVVKHIKTPLMLSVLLWGAGSCIREGDSNCPDTGFHVCFIPENPKHDYPLLVQSVDLYFYNETGDLFKTISYTKQGLRKSDKAAPVRNIPAGKYTMVSVVNDVRSYLTVNPDRLGTLQSLLVKELSDDRLVDFFSGKRELTVTREMIQGQEEVYTEIVKHTNNIHLEIIRDGYETPQGSDLSCRIEGNNGAYWHLLQVCPEVCFRIYEPYSEQKDEEGNHAAFNFSVMRLWRRTDLILYIQEIDAAQNELQTMQIRIADQLAKVRNDQGIFLYDTDKKLSFHDDYKISVKLGADFILLDLRINDWWVVKGGVDL